ncbi:hypothetical protein WMY93_022944 [Mugilogobius chulae]|uniref:Unconventional myosin-IXa-like n=1 Tax=Mugilogobius chulae TaxID=88201 RepID=A0AAW0N406_9GOBI
MDLEGQVHGTRLALGRTLCNISVSCCLKEPVPPKSASRSVCSTSACRQMDSKWEDNDLTVVWMYGPGAVLMVPPSLPQVFLREAEKQRLQALLHSEVLRLIVSLQRRFRAHMERRQFCRMREAALCIQAVDAAAYESAAVCLQTHWRGYRARQRFRLWIESALVLQRAWRLWLQHRCSAAVVIQTAWRAHQTRQRYLQLCSSVLQLQALCRGFLARHSFQIVKKQRLKEREDERLRALQNGDVIASPEEEGTPETIPGLDLSTWEASIKHQEETAKAPKAQCEDFEPATLPTVLRERSRTADEPSQKTTRSKRESRRMRELEQAKFSLELLKVRATTGAPSSPSEERRWSLEFVPPASPPLRSPQGTPDSQSSKGSFELLSMEEVPPKAVAEITDTEDLCSPVHSVSQEEPSVETVPTSPKLDKPSSPTETEPTAPTTHPPKLENYLPTFYVPESSSTQQPANEPQQVTQTSSTTTTTTTTTTSSTTSVKPLKERRESSRRPVVVVISMQKETPLSEELTDMVRPPVELRDTAAQTGELTPSPQNVSPAPRSDQAIIDKLEKLNVEKEERQRSQQQQNEKEMMAQIRQQKEVIERQRLFFAQCEKDMFEKQRDGALQKIQHGRKEAQEVTRKPSRPSSLCIDKASGPTPRARTESESTPPSARSPPAVDIQGVAPQPQLPPQTVSSPRHKDGKVTPEGWVPKVKLESREGGALKGKSAPKKQPVQQGTAVNLSDKTSNIFFSPKDKVTFTKFDSDAVSKAGPTSPKEAAPAAPKTSSKSSKSRDVGRAGQKKKARMARTRSDFLTRAPVPSAVGGDSDDDDSPLSPRHFTLPLPKTSPGEEAEACFSDSDMMPSGEEKKKMHKAMSSGDLGKVESLRKNSQDGRVRKMKFWGKSKYGEKKTSREKLVSGADSLDLDSVDAGALLGEGQENMSPPLSPSGTLERGSRDLKENKEPSPKVKRRRSVKISSVTLEPAQWQNDSLHILSCSNDYRSMNDFLMKKINDLETEDSKKDTMVDVVFKKALKEFRLNIFITYSTALRYMDECKSVRYKDLYALFEHILEKTMRQEQRDWSESPVRVWVNTFKVFLDEFMTEYKPMDSTLSRQVPKTERKKRRKKDTDIVEEHNGHIFKSTQYSIPTYCEYCSSLIWMMDRACVCKLCRYACHRKCCQKTTTKCSKKFDPELSARQFGVEVSRLTSDERAVPLVVEKLMNYIEMHGLYTEGIYRKPGSANKIKELKQGLDTDVESTTLDDYNIHVIGSVFKQWLRDLPNPLMTFELYEEFIRAMGLQDKKEMVRGVYSVIDQLSRTHLNTLERLIFHLVRIALQEETNRMSANALAIVFAPCILRCPDTIDPLQSVQDISKTTACVELIICEQMNKYKVRLKDINTLEFAENKAKCRLTLIRRSMRAHYRASSSPPLSPRVSTTKNPAATEPTCGEEPADPDLTEHQQAAMQQEERVLTEQIENLQKEKEELTFEMLALEPRASDDETLESEASIGTADSSENLNVDSEGLSDLSGALLTSPWPRRSDGRSPRQRTLRRQPDSLDSVDSCSSVSSYSSSSHFQPSAAASSNTRRFRFHSKSPSSPTSAAGPSQLQPTRTDTLDLSPTGEPDRAKRESVLSLSALLSLSNVQRTVPKCHRERVEGTRVWQDSLVDLTVPWRLFTQRQEEMH